MIPLDTICVDLVGPYTVTDITGDDCMQMRMIFAYSATGWFKIKKFPKKEKSSAIKSQLFNKKT